MIRSVLTAAAAAALLTAASAAAAQGPQIAEVRVTIGAKLAKNSDYGARDLDRLAADLDRSVEQALRRAGRLSPDGGRLELVLEDVRPNRPTFEQMNKRPGLSLQSIAVGGAEISGVESFTDGSSRPVSFRWYENDIREARGSATWTDAERAFDMFARKYAGGR